MIMNDGLIFISEHNSALAINNEDAASYQKMLRSFSENVSIESNHSQLRIRLPVTLLDQENLNKRIYPTPLIQEVVESDDLKYRAENGYLIGAADDHPTTSYVAPINGSHLVTRVWVERINSRNYLMNEWLTMLTSKGKELKSLFESGASFGVSIRGFGITDNKNDPSQGRMVKYKYLATDAVGDPSSQVFAGANVPHVSLLEYVDPKSVGGNVMFEGKSKVKKEEEEDEKEKEVKKKSDDEEGKEKEGGDDKEKEEGGKKKESYLGERVSVELLGHDPRDDTIDITINGTHYKQKITQGDAISVWKSVQGMKRYSPGKALQYLLKRSDTIEKEGKPYVARESIMSSYNIPVADVDMRNYDMDDLDERDKVDLDELGEMVDRRRTRVESRRKRGVRETSHDHMYEMDRDDDMDEMGDDDKYERSRYDDMDEKGNDDEFRERDRNDDMDEMGDDDKYEMGRDDMDEMGDDEDSMLDDLEEIFDCNIESKSHGIAKLLDALHMFDASSVDQDRIIESNEELISEMRKEVRESSSKNLEEIEVKNEMIVDMRNLFKEEVISLKDVNSSQEEIIDDLRSVMKSVGAPIHENKMAPTDVKEMADQLIKLNPELVNFKEELYESVSVDIVTARAKKYMEGVIEAPKKTAQLFNPQIGIVRSRGESIKPRGWV